MDIKELSKVPTMEEFNQIKAALNLTARQKKIFYYKYSRFWRNADIAEQLGVHTDTVSEDVCIIRDKVLAARIEQLKSYVPSEEEIEADRIDAEKDKKREEELAK